MPKRTPQDWETMDAELHAAGVSPAEIEAGARKLLAEARGHRLAEAQRHLGFTQKDIAAAMSVSIARVSQIEHGEVASFEVIARYVEGAGRAPGPSRRLRRPDCAAACQHHRDRCRMTSTPHLRRGHAAPGPAISVDLALRPGARGAAASGQCRIAHRVDGSAVPPLWPQRSAMASIRISSPASPLRCRGASASPIGKMSCSHVLPSSRLASSRIPLGSGARQARSAASPPRPSARRGHAHRRLPGWSSRPALAGPRPGRCRRQADGDLLGRPVGVGSWVAVLAAVVPP